jgi:potassium-dependent mechanosensitive channel
MVLNRARHFARLFLCGLLLLSATTLAADPVTVSQVASPPFPEFSQVAPYVTELQNDAAATRTQLAALQPPERISEDLSATEERFQVLVQQMSALGEVETWYADRLLDFDEQLKLLRSNFNALQEELTFELTQLEDLRSTWEGKRTHLADWQVFLSSKEGKVPEELFQQGRDSAGKTLNQIDAARQPLLELQQQVSAALPDVQQERSKLDAALRMVKTEVFRKNSHSFFSPEFYQQFRQDLLDEIQSGTESALTIGDDFMQRFGWLIVAQLLLALTLPLLILRFHHHAQQPEEWTFILKHPWATGIFVAVAAIGGFYQAPPQLVRFILYALGIGSVAILIAALTQSQRRARVVLFMAVLFLLSTAMRMVSLPLPLYRIYLLVLYLVGAPVLWWVSVRAYRFRGRLTGFIIALRLGSILVAVALIAQLSGYVNFSFGLVEASIETVFAYLFLLMALKLGFGAIDFLLSLQWFRTRKFIRQHGVQLAQRLKKVLRLAGSIYVIFFLSEVWGVFDSVADAWAALLNWSMKVGEAELSLRMVLLAGVTLYLTYEISWFLQASIDTQILQRRQLDRGVRDAIKKLLHYALVLIGFMLAISALGFQLQHLVVVAGAFGVGIGFGLQDIVNNFLSGLILLFERPVKVGDGILVDGEYGTVVKIGLRSTVVETLDQSELIVPNSQMISQKVTNWTLSTRRVRLMVPVGVAYGSDVPLVMEILTAAGSEHADVLDDPPVSPIFVAFGESSLDFELRVWIPNVDMRPRVKSELLLYIDRGFREAGVEIPFPQRDLHLRSANGKLLGALDGERSE